MADLRRITIHRITAKEVEVGDYLTSTSQIGCQVTFSARPQGDLWHIESENQIGDNDYESIELYVQPDSEIIVARAVPLEPDQCITCGQYGVKYAARHQCARCYQRDRRAKAAPATADAFSDVQVALQRYYAQRWDEEELASQPGEVLPN